MIELKGISKNYHTPQGIVHALDDIHLSIGKADIFGVIGRSGAGKSTLIRTVNLLENPDCGQVIVNGVELTRLPEKELRQQRQKIGMIFQHFNLLSSKTVFENVAYPLHLARQNQVFIEHKVHELLEIMEISDKKNKYPSQLSGGQKQRVAIARALANNPKVLLCDEATSALDAETTKSILKFLKKINKEYAITIMLITHEMQVVKEICNRVAVIDKGKIVEEESMVHFFSAPKSHIGKSLISAAFHLNLPDHILNLLKPHAESNYDPILKLVFYGANATEPLISGVSKQFGLDVSIIQAHIDSICEQPLGIMICQAFGSNETIQHAIEYLKSKHVHVETIGYVPRNIRSFK